MRNLYNSIINSIGPHPVRFFSIYHHSVFLAAQNVGLSSTIHTQCCRPLADAGSFDKKNAKELAQLVWSDNLLARSIGFAAINSKLNAPELLKNSSNVNAMELLIDKGRGKNVAILGNFPRVRQLRENNQFKSLSVFELRPPDETYFTEKDYERILPHADVVLFTAVALINHTIFDFYKYIEKSFKILTGPSAPLYSGFLDFGIDAVCGSVVTDEEEARRSLSQGSSYRYAKGIQKVTLLREKR
jgi:uncharacterized protein (DUF4213/DUF364 family)